MELHNILLMSLTVAILFLLMCKGWIMEKDAEILPIIKKTLDLGACMTIGTREVQEDCYLLKESKPGTLMVVADGMGTAYGGRIAARTAVETFGEIFKSYTMLDNPKYFFKKALHSANHEILKALDNGQRGGASVGVAIVYENKLFYCVVGNVKIFVYRNGDLIQVSTGHTIDVLAKNEFKTGKITRVEALSILENQKVYNYLGQDGFTDIELFEAPITINANDIIIIMTDGIYDLLTCSEIEQTLHKPITCQQMALELIEKVNTSTQEEKDNASIALLR